VVAIGNAPTAQFRLLEEIDAGAARPALILAFPVGFVGAAESKAELAREPRGVAYVTAARPARRQRDGRGLGQRAARQSRGLRPVTPWLSIVGLGEDGLDGLPAAPRALIAGAETLIGGERHLAMVPPAAPKRLCWTTPLSRTLDAIESRRGRRVCVLATGDPMWFGIASR
jgi:hypothetical protein